MLTETIHAETYDHFGTPRQFYCHDTQLARHVTNDVLSGSSYPAIDFIKNVKTCVDIGANVGASAIYFSRHYPEARILAFEPSPNSYDILTKNVLGIDAIETFNFALSDMDDTVTFFLGRESVLDSMANSKDAVEQMHVEARDAAVVFQELGLTQLDILKVDTEGCEVRILETLIEWLKDIRVIYVEFHSERDRREIDSILTETHMLCVAHQKHPHRGELTYVLRSEVPVGVDNEILEVS